jgi:uncharacterized protein (DUF433 family)
MSTTVNVELTDAQMAWLEQEAKRLDRSMEATIGIYLEQLRRESDFHDIEFRDTVIGRQAYLRGTRLKIWMIADIHDAYDGDFAKTEEHLNIPRTRIEAALAYAAAFSSEIEEAIAGNSRTADELRALIPNLEVFTVDATPR